MKLHYGTKAIMAKPMTRQEYNDYRGWTLPDNEDGTDDGYLVEYIDGGASNHPDHNGYISWSPEDVFNNAYKSSGKMNFGHAIEAMKDGHKVARAGWNGKGMWLSLSGNPKTCRSIPAEAFWSENNANFAKEQGGNAGVLPCITMKTATNEILMGWLASQTDMLAEDWEVIQ